MANVDNPHGLFCVGSLTATGAIPKPRRYLIPSSDATAVFIGDAVKLAGSADSVTGVATVAQAAAGDTIIGAVVAVDEVAGVAVTSENLYRTHRPASTAMYVWVIDDPLALFQIQGDSVGATEAVGDVGLNADIVVAAGDATTGYSGMELDTSTKATTNTLQLQILGFINSPDNEIGSANPELLVRINDHQYANQVTGV